MTDQTPNLQAEPTRKKGLRWKIIGGVAGLLVVTAAIAGIAAVNITAAAEEDAKASASASRSAAARRVEVTQSAEASQKAAVAKAKADLDRSTEKLFAGLQADAQEQKDMEAAGWTYVSDHLYYVRTPSGSVDCGTTYRCAGFSVVSQNPNGCPGGIYLEASFLTNDDVSVGHDGQYTGALGAGQQAVFKLYDRSGAGQLVDVTSMRCR